MFATIKCLNAFYKKEDIGLNKGSRLPYGPGHGLFVQGGVGSAQIILLFIPFRRDDRFFLINL